jgi:ATP-dependent Lhr-like helicase
MRVAGAQVLLVDSALAAYVPRGGRDLTVMLPEDEPRRSQVARAVATRLASRGAGDEPGAGRGRLVERVNGQPAPEHPIAPALLAAGFVRAGAGLLLPSDERAPRAGAARA